MKYSKKKIKIPNRELTIICIIAITMILMFSGYSMAKAYQNTNIQVNGKIAEPILIIEDNPVVKVYGKNEKEYYNFKIKNTKENGEISPIALSYNIEILTQQQEAFSFKLYKNDEEIKLKNNKTDNIKLVKGKAQEDNYKLEIIYDKNHTVDEIIQDVQIKVHSEQLPI